MSRKRGRVFKSTKRRLVIRWRKEERQANEFLFRMLYEEEEYNGDDIENLKPDLKH